MNRFIKPLLLALALLSSVVAIQAAEHGSPVRENVSPEQRREVLQALEQWKQAVIKQDRAGLERAYHPDLSYGHTDGAVLTRQEQIDRTIDPNRDFTQVDITDVAVRVYGNVAFVTGGFAFHVLPKGGEVRVARLSGLDVWTKGSQGWQLIARQLTRLPDNLQQAAAIHKEIVTFDNHLDIPFEFGTGALDAATDGKSQFDLPKAEAGILKGGAIAIFVPQGARTVEGFQQARAKAEQKYEILTSIAKKYPERAEIAYTPADVRRIEQAGKFAIVLSVLNGSLIGHDLAQIDAWQAKGVRLFGFNHNGNNDLSDSSRPHLLLGDKLGEHGGLSPLGKQAVTRLNELGVVIDVSQLSANALAQVLSITKAPVVASHSNARAIIDHPRNLSDEQLLAIKKNGGVVAVNAYSSWVRPLPPEAQRKLNEIRAKYGVPQEKNIAGVQPVSDQGVKVLPREVFAKYSEEFHHVTGGEEYRATLAEYVNQIDYVVKKIGIDHVGISSDFNHGGGVIGWKDESESLNVTAELLQRGYTQEQIAKLWGGNFLRVWEQVQALAKS